MSAFVSAVSPSDFLLNVIQPRVSGNLAGAEITGRGSGGFGKKALRLGRWKLWAEELAGLVSPEPAALDFFLEEKSVVRLVMAW